MNITVTMTDRVKRVGSTWKDEGEGYASLASNAFAGAVAYVALPADHPDVGGGCDDLRPEVNGGLTFGDGNVFGWDYAHAYNTYDVQGDIARALAYFRARVGSASDAEDRTP